MEAPEIKAGGEAPPVLSALDNPAPPSALFNAFGVLTAEPLRIIEEKQKKNHVKILIYEAENAYFFGYQFKVDRLVRQKLPTISDKPLASLEEARMGAISEIRQICAHSRFVRDLFEDFTKIVYNQMELF